MIEKFDNHPTIGAFEVSIEDKILFSKIKEKKYPEPEEIEKKLIELGYQTKPLKK